MGQKRNEASREVIYVHRVEGLVAWYADCPLEVPARKSSDIRAPLEKGSMGLRRFWFLTIAVLTPMLSVASVSKTALPTVAEWQEAQRDRSGVWISALRQSRFSTIEHSSARSSCEVSEPPEALATPDPLLEIPDAKTKVTVSFIVGTDGRVHSPLILESAGVPQDRTVLNAVRSWRYRPAKCNGVPTEAEGKIQFLGR